MIRMTRLRQVNLRVKILSEGAICLYGQLYGISVLRRNHRAPGRPPLIGAVVRSDEPPDVCETLQAAEIYEFQVNHAPGFAILYVRTVTLDRTMARPRRNKLPKYLEFNSRTRSYYYRNPGMEKKAALGKDTGTAIELANVLNSKYPTRLEAALDFGSPRFEAAMAEYVHKYIVDYRIKPSTAALLRQRRDRLTKCLGDV